MSEFRNWIKDCSAQSLNELLNMGCHNEEETEIIKSLLLERK